MAAIAEKLGEAIAQAHNFYYLGARKRIPGDVIYSGVFVSAKNFSRVPLDKAFYEEIEVDAELLNRGNSYSIETKQFNGHVLVLMKTKPHVTLRQAFDELKQKAINFGKITPNSEAKNIGQVLGEIYETEVLQAGSGHFLTLKGILQESGEQFSQREKFEDVERRAAR